MGTFVLFSFMVRAAVNMETVHMLKSCNIKHQHNSRLCCYFFLYLFLFLQALVDALLQVCDATAEEEDDIRK